MTMEFGDTAEHAIERVEKATELTVIEGGAIVAGLIGASFLGRTIEGYVKPNVTKNSSTMDKIVAWGANALPKLGLYKVLEEHSRRQEDRTRNLVLADAKKAALASVFLDTAIRLSNGGVNTLSAKILGFDILNAGRANMSGNRMTNISGDLQKVIQENSVLRGQLNQALQRLASSPAQQVRQPINITPTQPINIRSTQPMQPVISSAPVVRVQPLNVPPDHDRQYGMMQTPEAVERRRRYGAMDPSTVEFGFAGEAEDRRKRYGSMDPGFAGEPADRRRRYGAMESVPPAISERDRKYNFMSKGKFNFAGEEDSIAALYGML